MISEIEHYPKFNLGSSKPSGVYSTEVLNYLILEVQELYQQDEIPWVIGYSGGKDSTAVLQLVWMAIGKLPEKNRHKQIFVISTDTLVENPIVSMWVSKSLEKMAEQAKREGLPISSHKLTPDIKQTFWVNLIGRGYPAPRPRFRWCTDRLKISPSTEFIKSKVSKYKQAIIVLGTRKSESVARGNLMRKLDAKIDTARFRPHVTMENSKVYSPIEDWTNDDVWTFLTQKPNPWGYDNGALQSLYQGASPDGECPLVIDTSTPSCGDSRLGCWVCTMVSKDKSMEAMITNDEEKDWMLPLLELRNALDPQGKPDKDKELREPRRMHGNIHILNGSAIPGPYTKTARENWLRQVLRAQIHVRKNGPPEVKDIDLISVGEMDEIRNIWLHEKHEIEDSLPRVYEEVTGEKYTGRKVDAYVQTQKFVAENLSKVCDQHTLHYKLVSNLLSTEEQLKHKKRRTDIFEKIQDNFEKFAHETEEAAFAWELSKKNEIDEIENSLTKGKVDSPETSSSDSPISQLGLEGT